jgi:formate dehydrogenase accessory protein FdhD
MTTPVASVSIVRHENDHQISASDIVVAEEPLEIRLGHGPLTDRKELRLSVTMRTPGHDEELALGFLFTEGIITDLGQVLRVNYCANVKEEERGNVLRAELHPEVDIDPARWQRNFYTSSSCGVCGKSSIEAVRTQCTRALTPFGPIDPQVITALPDRMREAQTVFKHTGGIHAAALFSREGELLILHEDVGPPQCCGQGDRGDARLKPRGAEARQLPTPGQRPRRFRTGAEMHHGRHPADGRRGCPFLTGRAVGPGKRNDLDRLPARGAVQCLHGWGGGKAMLNTAR